MITVLKNLKPYTIRIKFNSNIENKPYMYDEVCGSNFTNNKEDCMPKKMEKELKVEAKKKGLTGKRADAYVYGTMRKTGWEPKRSRKK